MKRLKYLFLIIITVLLSSCFKKKESVTWDAKVLTPIAHSSLGVENLISDTLYRVESDSSMTLVSHQNLYELKIDSLVPFDGQEFVERVLIRDFPITTRDVSHNVIVRDFVNSIPSPFFRAYLIASDDQMVEVPPFKGLSSPPQDIVADAVFTSADIITGNLNTTVRNDLSFALANITYTVKNKSDGSLIGSGVIDTIRAGETVHNIIPLDGKHVEGTLVYEITNLDVVGSNGVPVLLDLDKGLFVNVVATDLKAKELTAVFPQQDFIQRDFETELEGIKDKRLTRVRIKSGKIKIKYYSTAPDQVKFTYTIPAATINADTFKFIGYFNRAINGQIMIDTLEKDISGFDLDLNMLTETGGFQPNTFRSKLSAGFEYTGRMVTITENDSIRMEIKLVDVIPAYAKGYLGKDTFDIGPATANFDVFKDLENINIAFDEVKLSLNITSGAGLEAKVDVTKIDGLNSKTGVTTTLSMTQPSVSIPAAIETPFTPSHATHTLDNTNSNIKAFLDNKPDVLTYQAKVITNPNTDTSIVSTIDMNQFLTDASSFKVDLNVEVPLRLNVNNFSIMDTTLISDFALTNIDKIKDGTLSLLLENEIPIGMTMKLIVLDQLDIPVDSIWSQTPVLAADVDPNTGKLISSKKQRIDYYFDNARLVRLLTADKIIFKAVFNSADSKYSKLAINNKLKVNLVGKFNYLVSSK